MQRSNALAYRIEIRPKVEKALRKLPKRTVESVEAVIDGLANDHDQGEQSVFQSVRSGAFVSAITGFSISLKTNEPWLSL